MTLVYSLIRLFIYYYYAEAAQHKIQKSVTTHNALYYSPILHIKHLNTRSKRIPHCQMQLELSQCVRKINLASCQSD